MEEQSPAAKSEIRNPKSEIDISVAVRPGMVVWADEIPVELTPIQTVARDEAAVSRLCLGTHTGTHVDPPKHFIEGGAGAHELPLDAMIGPCVVRRFDERFEITAVHLESASIPEGTTRLLLSTPAAALWDSPRFHTNYTGLSFDGAEWCVRRGIRLVGIDYLSIERVDSPTVWRTHTTLLAASVVILEGLDLRAVPEGDYTLVCLPLKLQDGDGAPARAVLLPL
ncbi:MAG TPA: cyclase family protein [Chloroflexia bacterium]|nr:cyclase family protein [Chloroflexia bacterium]